MQTNGILGIILLALNIFAAIKIFSSSESTIMKIVWTLVVFLLPLLGLIIWFFIGPGDKRFKL